MGRKTNKASKVVEGVYVALAQPGKSFGAPYLVSEVIRRRPGGVDFKAHSLREILVSCISGQRRAATGKPKASRVQLTAEDAGMRPRMRIISPSRVQALQELAAPRNFDRMNRSDYDLCWDLCWGGGA